ncbi:Regulator of RpoS [Paenibacillus allorhizoplanae]|uniref:Regulator of RpoS n=1 Tax=Paenibacillus allorhizoplanae TaxID=2905648 RepID=A0ABM9CWT6_9BACL|nr:response regulator [Paenibacillus allorhizoplanae]CAH1227766.1 Regulator of RpoS [Paenibacillus allorhizoplanae]
MLNAMIVEDNAIYRYAIKSIIRWEDYGFHIVNEALNGVHALDILQHQHVDLILTDISMPEMNGIDLIQKVKQQDDSIKIVALSSFDDFRYVKEALKLGAEDYLLKHDLEPESLQQLLRQMKTKIEDELQLKRQAAIRNENLQEMWHLLGRKLIFGELKKVDEMEDQARAIRFPIPTGPIAIMLFEGEFNANSTRALLSELGEVLIHIPITDHRTVIMRHFPNATSEQTCREELLRHAAVLMENAGEASTLTIGISSTGHDLMDWSTLYRQAEKALEQSIYDGVGQVYSYWAKSSEIQGVEVSMKAYASAIQSGQFEAVDKQTELFFDLLLTRRLSLEELKVVIHEATILTKAAAIGRGKFSASAESTYRQINRAIEAFPTIQQLKQLFQTWQKELNYEAMGNTPFRKEIQAAIAYIEEHYAEDITVSKLAESLHLSSNYVSNLFKSETGLRFVEYLNRYRIRRAKLLLQDPSWKVYEVAEKTGFQEASYFCKVFKELEGKTVKEFRCES